MILIMRHQGGILFTIEFLDLKRMSHKQSKKKKKAEIKKKQKKRKEKKKFDYSIMHSGYSSKSKQEGKCQENKKSPGKK